MKIYDRIKQIREDKKLSQSYIANELHLDQSQYSRRENGEIAFIPDELEIISKILDTPISKLFGEETNVFNNIDQKGGNFAQHQYINIPEKLIEQYESRLKEKDELIEFLKSKF